MPSAESIFLSWCNCAHPPSSTTNRSTSKNLLSVCQSKTVRFVVIITKNTSHVACNHCQQLNCWLLNHIHPIESGLGIDHDGGGVVSDRTVNMVGGGLATIEAWWWAKALWSAEALQRVEASQWDMWRRCNMGRHHDGRRHCNRRSHRDEQRHCKLRRHHNVWRHCNGTCGSVMTYGGIVMFGAIVMCRAVATGKGIMMCGGIATCGGLARGHAEAHDVSMMGQMAHVCTSE
jgi:hypothetical protein